MTDKLRHVFPIAGKFSFRLSLPGHKFVCEERWDRQNDCGLYCDLFKLFLVRQYGVKGSAVLPSLPHAELKKELFNIGLDSHNMKDLFSQLPASCQSFIEIGGGECVRDYLKNDAEVRQRGFGDL